MAVLVGMGSVESLRFDIERKECWVHEVPLDGELVHVSFTVFQINQWAYRHTGADLVVSGLHYVNPHTIHFLSLLCCSPSMTMRFITLLSCMSSFYFLTCQSDGVYLPCPLICNFESHDLQIYVVGSACIESTINSWDPDITCTMVKNVMSMCNFMFILFFTCD